MIFMNSISFCNVMLLWASYLSLKNCAGQTIHLAEFNKSACKADCTEGLQSFSYKCQFTIIVKNENNFFENGSFNLLYKNMISGNFEPLSSLKRLKDCDDFSKSSDYRCFRNGTNMFYISMYVKAKLLNEGAEVKCKIIINTTETVSSNVRHVIGLTDMPDRTHVAGYLTVNGQSALIDECNIKIAGEHLEINFQCNASTKECAIRMDINGGQKIKYDTNSIKFNQNSIGVSEVNVHINISSCTLDENVTSFNCTLQPGTLDKSSPVETTKIIIATTIAVGSLIVICIPICILLKKKSNTKSKRGAQPEEPRRIPEEEKLLQQTETKTGKGRLLEDIHEGESNQLDDTCFIDIAQATDSLDESSDTASNKQSVSSLSDNACFIHSQAIVNNLLDDNAIRLDEHFVDESQLDQSTDDLALSSQVDTQESQLDQSTDDLASSSQVDTQESQLDQSTDDLALSSQVDTPGTEESFSSPSDNSPLKHSITIVNDLMKDNLRQLAKEFIGK
ncbi:unnamed protein product, partial [Lymnaea stagnalis]